MSRSQGRPARTTVQDVSTHDTASGKVILLIGPSSAGKSTLCRAIQQRTDEPFIRYSLDFFFDSDALPTHRSDGPFAWREQRPKLFEGYFRSLAALASAGNNLVLDFVIETPQQLTRLVTLLRPFDVFLVGVHCPLPELERRERARGNRRLGDAHRDLETVHTFTTYDFEVDSTHPVDENADRVIHAWQQRTEPGILQRLAARDA